MRSKLLLIVSIVIASSMLLGACSPAATPTMAPATEAPKEAATTAPEPTKAVEPTKPLKLPHQPKLPHLLLPGWNCQKLILRPWKATSTLPVLQPLVHCLKHPGIICTGWFHR